jgi:predicted dehydrogenase
VTPDSPFGIGLIGAGGFGTFCLQAFEELVEARVVAVADVDVERARKVAPEGARVYGDYQTLLADGAVDIVAINTPPFLHGRMVQEAAEAGKHIFVEKPLATSMEKAWAAAQAVQESRVRLGINYVLRRHPLHRLAAQLIHGQVFGPLQYWSLENLATDEALLPGHWFWDKERSGGIHVEHGVHFFDLCNYLAGAPPDSVTGWELQRADGRADRVGATLIYGQGLVATFYHSFNRINCLEETTIRLHCARGSLVLEGWIPTRLSLTGLVDETALALLERLQGDGLQIEQRFTGAESEFSHGGVTERLTVAVGGEVTAPQRQLEYRRAIKAGMRDLVGAIREGREPEVGLEDALQSLAVALVASDIRS